jgi:hypothetical protein
VDRVGGTIDELIWDCDAEAIGGGIFLGSECWGDGL